MTALARPDTRLWRSWAETVTEFGSERMNGSGFFHGLDGPLDLTEAGCERFVAMLLRWSDPSVELPENRVHCDHLWITDGAGAKEEVVGFLALRHALTPELLEEGGHIGYSVRPSRRGEGHAGGALALAVRRAAELGLDPVLLTCDEANVASARTIERNGGVHEETRNGTRRYWIETGAAPTTSRAPGGRTATPA